MHIFKRRELEWWQVGALKLSLLCIGIAIGTYWQEAFMPYATWLIVLGLGLGIYVAIVWMKQQ